MNAKDLRKLLEEAEDKFAIFTNIDILKQGDFTVGEFGKLVDEFLKDEQKQKLFDLDVFLNLTPALKSNIISTIKDDDIVLELIERDEVISGFKDYHFTSAIRNLGEKGKIKLLRDQELLKKIGLKNYDIKDMVKSLNDKNKREILEDSELVKALGLNDYDMVNIISSFKREKTKIEALELYKLPNELILGVLETLSDERKTEILKENPYGLKGYNLMYLASTLTADGVVWLFKDNKDFLDENHIKPYEITSLFDKEKATEFISKIEDTDLKLEEKRQIMVTLDEEVKAEIDKSKLLPEYVSALEIKISNWKEILVDFDGDLEKYRGLDQLIFVDGTKVPKDKLLQLYEICPKLHIKDSIGLEYTSIEEYKSAENWIESVLGEINPEWTEIQKVAFIDNAIGRKISYSPDFDTEVFDASGARNLWKIINSGYGVCNGISSVEEYILNRLGIESERVSSKKHNFIRLKNIELPTHDGETVRGDTIIDPTWNLAAHRYKGLPLNFCKSYEEMRKQDINSNGVDMKSHKNDELADITLSLDEKNLRKIFSSIGIADREGNFPIKDLISESDRIYDENGSGKRTVEKQLALIEEYCPEFATCQNSTMGVLQGNILGNDKLKFNKCVVKRVYDRKDENKRPVLYVYIDLPEEGTVFYVADKEEGKFVEYAQIDFELKFECYEEDIEKDQGHRPWEKGVIEVRKDPTKAQEERMIADEGDGR